MALRQRDDRIHGRKDVLETVVQLIGHHLLRIRHALNITTGLKLGAIGAHHQAQQEEIRRHDEDIEQHRDKGAFVELEGAVGRNEKVPGCQSA